MALEEWILNVAAHGQSYFKALENWLDTFIAPCFALESPVSTRRFARFPAEYAVKQPFSMVQVWVVGVFLLWIAPLILGREGLAALQAIRAIRAMRSLRSFKVLRHFESFRMLLTGVLGTIPTLAACILMIFLTDLTFGIVSVDLIGGGGKRYGVHTAC